jgi:hypothetical protein
MAGLAEQQLIPKAGAAIPQLFQPGETFAYASLGADEN